MTDLIETNCRCGKAVMSSPRSTIEASCIECRYEDCGTDARYDPQGEWHPSVGYPSPGSGWRLSPEGVPDEPFPEPQRTSREAGGFFTPTAVLSLQQYAIEHGWEVRTQYSVGNVPHATTGKPGELRELVGIRFGRHPMTERMAYAVYSRRKDYGGWSWGSVMVWGPDLPPFAGCGVTELKAYLQAPGIDTEAIRAWVDDLKAIKQNGDGLRKMRTRMRTEVKNLTNAGESLADVVKHAEGVFTRDEVVKILEIASKSGKDTNREGLR